MEYVVPIVHPCVRTDWEGRILNTTNLVRRVFVGEPRRRKPRMRMGSLQARLPNRTSVAVKRRMSMTTMMMRKSSPRRNPKKLLSRSTKAKKNLLRKVEVRELPKRLLSRRNPRRKLKKSRNLLLLSKRAEVERLL